MTPNKNYQIDPEVEIERIAKNRFIHPQATPWGLVNPG
jgi:hypothetical protein